MSISERSVDFGEKLIRGVNSQPQIVLAKPRIPLGQVTASSSSRFIQAVLEKRGEGYQLVIQPSRDLPSGILDAKIDLHLLGPNGETLPDQTIAISGVVTEPVAATPNCVELGVRKIGSTVKETILLRSEPGFRSRWVKFFLTIRR